MLVPAYNQFTSACQCTGKKLVIIRVFADLIEKRWSSYNLGVLDDKFQSWFQVDGWALRRQFFSNVAILLQNIKRDNQIKLFVPPCAQDLIRRSAEKDA